MRALVAPGAPAAGAPSRCGPSQATLSQEVLPQDALTELYAYPARPPQSGTHLRVNFVSTVDGAAAGADGRSGSINDAADQQVFRLLRSLSDVVLAGAGTVRTEGYRAWRPPAAFAEARAARSQAPAPSIAVVTRSGALPTDSGLFGGPAPTFVLTCEAAGADGLRRLRSAAGAEQVLVSGERDVDLVVALRALADRGLWRVLCEGGPTLLGGLLSADLVDELCLTWTPLLVGGDAPRIVTSPPLRQTLTLRHLLEQDGTLLGRWSLAG